MNDQSRRPRFSILTLLLSLTITGLALGVFAAHRETSKVQNELEEAKKFQKYLKDEVGYIDSDDDSKLYIRELENHVPLARRFLVDFPHGYYNVVIGDYLGGEFELKNLSRRHQSRTFLKMTTHMSIHIFENPDDKEMFSVDTVDFTSGQAGGGFLPDYEIDINELNFSDDQHHQASRWRILNERPHGEIKIYDQDTDFIPLFLLEGHISAKGKDGEFKPIKGLAVWMETAPKSK